MQQDVDAICAAAQVLGVASLRAPLLALRAAQAHALLHSRQALSVDDLEAAVALVLSPRATQAPELPETQEPAPPPEQDPTDTDTPPPPPEAQAALEDLVVAAARAAIPNHILAALADGMMKKGQSGQGARRFSVLRGRPIGARAGLPRNGARLALLATLRAAAPWQALRRKGRENPAPLVVHRDDLRIRHFEERSETSAIFVVDASGSAAFQRMAEVKGAIELILSQAYVTRTHVGLVAFRQEGAQILVPPTRSLARARARLAALPGGGPTPLAAGLDAGLTLAIAERARGRRVIVLVMSDGRANVARDGQKDRRHALSDAMDSATRFRVTGVDAVFVDTGRWPATENETLARAMGARYAPLPFADASAISALAAS
jgi:magnesium chelatase subunit D